MILTCVPEKLERGKNNTDKTRYEGEYEKRQKITDFLIFSFTPECRLPERSRYSLVDRIFNAIFRETENLERRKQLG